MTEPAQEPNSLRAVTTAAERLGAAEAERQAASDELARAMYAAHVHGHTWSTIAEGAGLASPHTARTRARSALDASDLSPSARWRREHGHAPRPDSRAPGMSVSEAARHYDVTRATIYAWVKSGKLRSTTDEAGRTRVMPDEE